jgi:hypothetical protein
MALDTSLRSLMAMLMIPLILYMMLVVINLIMEFLKTRLLTMVHLGSGTLKADGSEQVLFEYVRNEPFTIMGYVNLKNMTDGDVTTINSYVKLAVDDEYTLYASQTYRNKQKQPLLYIQKLPALRGFKITLKQEKGEYKYYPFEFYMGVVG